MILCNLSGDKLLNHTANMLVWDVELTSLDVLHRQYDLTVNIKRFSPDEIVRDWTMLGASWKRIGEDKVSCVSVSSKNPLDDYMVVKKTYEALEQADILIGHNSDAFDLKKFNTRAIYYDMPPLPQKQQIDTLKEARKYFKFTSNKLSYLAKYLKIGAKDESPDWDEILEGNAEELSKMREYNKMDVIVTEQIYFKLRSWMRTHPDVSLYSPIKDIKGKTIKSCPKCNSMNYHKDGSRYTKTKAIPRLRCNDCGGAFDA